MKSRLSGLLPEPLEAALLVPDCIYPFVLKGQDEQHIRALSQRRQKCFDGGYGLVVHGVIDAEGHLAFDEKATAVRSLCNDLSRSARQAPLGFRKYFAVAQRSP